MTAMDILAKAIFTRTSERLFAGELPITEMWLTPETYDRLMEDAKEFCVYPAPPREHPECCGVVIRRIGDP